MKFKIGDIVQHSYDRMNQIPSNISVGRIVSCNFAEDECFFYDVIWYGDDYTTSGYKGSELNFHMYQDFQEKINERMT